MVYVTPASAVTIYTNVSDITITSGQLFFDLGTNGTTGSASTSSFGAADFVFNLATFTISTLGGDIVGYDAVPYGHPAYIFPEGNSIDASYDWSNGGLPFTWYTVDGGFPPGSTGIFGLRTLNGSGEHFYGWARATFNVDQSLTLHDFAYNSVAEQPILAGQSTPVAEGGLGIVFLGCFFSCMLVYRRMLR